MIRSLIAVLATSVLAVSVTRHLSRRHRLRHESRGHREAVSRWEDEGGNLPAGDPADEPAHPAEPERAQPRADG